MVKSPGRQYTSFSSSCRMPVFTLSWKYTGSMLDGLANSVPTNVVIRRVELEMKVEEKLMRSIVEGEEQLREETAWRGLWELLVWPRVHGRASGEEQNCCILQLCLLGRKR